MTEPLSVRLVLNSPERVYDLSSFGSIEAGPSTAESFDPEPLPDNFLEVIHPKTRARIVDGPPYGDRSANDFAVARSLAKQGFTPGQVLTAFITPEWYVARKTRDKGLAYAIRTIVAAFEGLPTQTTGAHPTTPPEDLAALLERLHWVESEKGSRRQKEVEPDYLFTVPAVRWLAEHGMQFLRDVHTGDGFVFWKGRILRADKDSRELRDLLYELAHVTETAWDSRKLREALSHEARVNGNGVTLYPWVTFDPISCKGYLLPDSSSGELLVIAPNKEVEIASNGTDGFLLKPSLLSEPLRLDFATDKKEGIRKIVQLLSASFACESGVRCLATCYLLSVPLQRFASDDLLPILHVTGPSGGGKSWALKLMTTWLYGRSLLLQATQASSHAISDSDPFLALDDYESLDPEWQRRLLTGATGQVRAKMGAQATGVVLQQSTVCFAMTSINPLPTETLRRRAVVIETDAERLGDVGFNATTALTDLARSRNETWSAYIRLLAEDILPRMQSGSARQNIMKARDIIGMEQNKGLSTFLTLMWLVGVSIERYVPHFMPAIELEDVIQSWAKSLLLQSQEEFMEREPLIMYVDTVWDEILHSGGDLEFGVRTGALFIEPIIRGGSLVGFRGTGAQLHSTFATVCRNRGLRYEFSSPNQVGRRFQLSQNLLAESGWIVKAARFGPRRGWEVCKRD